jgi:polyhydroxybutyrate depolymerase
MTASAPLAAALAIAGCQGATSPDGASSPTATTSVTAVATPSTVNPSWAPGRHAAQFAVGGVTRTAVVVVPQSLSRPLPVLFMFHGHGGNGSLVDQRLDFDGLWPDAIVVYPDGLVGHKGITDPEGRLPGWQSLLGENGDSDLAFFDTMLATLRSALPVDTERVFVAGHSNGSQFASLLLNQRGSEIAATANFSAMPSAAELATDPVRSMFISLGTQDPIVAYDHQKLLVPLAEQHLGGRGGDATVNGYLRTERGAGRIEFATYIHPGGHEVPSQAPGLAVDFFKRHTLTGG